MPVSTSRCTSCSTSYPLGRVPVGRGRRRAPRLPFFVARGITRRSAKELVTRLHAAGFDARIETRWALASPQMRKKFSTMTGRHTIGGGALFYVGAQILRPLSNLLGHELSLMVYPSIFLLWGVTFVLVAVRYSSPIARRLSDGRQESNHPQQMAETLPRLRSRQDRPARRRILERLRVDSKGAGAARSQAAC